MRAGSPFPGAGGSAGSGQGPDGRVEIPDASQRVPRRPGCLGYGPLLSTAGSVGLTEEMGQASLVITGRDWLWVCGQSEGAIQALRSSRVPHSPCSL